MAKTTPTAPSLLADTIPPPAVNGHPAETAPETTPKPAKAKSGDAELLTMGRIQRHLDSLDPDAAARVVVWIYDRWRNDRIDA